MRSSTLKEAAKLSAATTYGKSSAEPTIPHRIEREVQHYLLSEPQLKFASLVVRRIRGGVCLEGVIEADDSCPDVCRLARQVAGVEQVLNHLVISQRPRAKG